MSAAPLKLLVELAPPVEPVCAKTGEPVESCEHVELDEFCECCGATLDDCRDGAEPCRIILHEGVWGCLRHHVELGQ